MADNGAIYNRVRRLEQAQPEPVTVDPRKWPLTVLNLMTARMEELAATDPAFVNAVTALKQEQARRARKGNGSGR